MSDLLAPRRFERSTASFGGNVRGNNWFILISLASSLLVNCTPNAPVKNAINITDSAIIGGQEVQGNDTIGQSIVAVYDAFIGQLCTGTLLKDNIVLTAAHCVGIFTEDMYIFFETEITDYSKPYQVDKIEISPIWSTRKHDKTDKGDLALLRFIGRAPSHKRPAQLLTYTKFNNLSENAEVVVAGYGLSDGVEQSGAGTLRSVKVNIANKNFSVSEVTLDQRNNRGTCHGDSGGPAFLLLGEKYYLWGVTSRGIEDLENDCSQFAATTHIYSHKTWISRMIQKLSTSILDPLTL